MPKLRKKLESVALRRTTKEVLPELPEMRIHSLPLPADLSSLPEEELNEVRSALAAKNPMAELKKIISHVGSLRRIIGMSKVASVAQWAIENIGA